MSDRQLPADEFVTFLMNALHSGYPARWGEIEHVKSGADHFITIGESIHIQVVNT